MTPAVAKWGAACAACAVVKAKCVRSNDTAGAKCDRCLRLRKECAVQVHRPRKKRQSKPSRTTQLEERLSSLVDALQAGGQIPAVLTPSRSPHTITGAEQRVPEQQQNTTQSSKDNALPTSFHSGAPLTCICRAPAAEEDLRPPDPDETLLSIYMDRLSTNFPFVIIPPGTTSEQLTASRPFLMQVIRMVASFRNWSSVHAQSYAVLRHICDVVLMRSERSLELLQGMLVFLGYFHFDCLMHSQFNNLTQLAISMVADMGLHRSPAVMERTRLLVNNMEEPRPRTNEERRVIAGVWYASSNAALTFHRVGSARYTKYIDECLRELEAAPEYETDVLLVHLIRIQHLTELIVQATHSDEAVLEIVGIQKPPLSTQISTYHDELERLRNAVPQKFRSNYLLIRHFDTALLRLYEPPLIFQNSLDTLPTSLDMLSLSNLSQMDICARSSSALKAWFEHWLEVPVREYFYLPLAASGQLIYGTTMLSRWAKMCAVKPLPPPPPATALEIEEQKQRLCLSSQVGNAMVPAGGSSTLSAFQERVRSEPELQIDALGILEVMATRFKAVKLKDNAPPGGVMHQDVWELAAKKIEFTRRKLERWSEDTAGAKHRQESSVDGSNGVDAGKVHRTQAEDIKDGEVLEVLGGIPDFGNGQEPTNSSTNLFNDLDIAQDFMFDVWEDWNFGMLEGFGH